MSVIGKFGDSVTTDHISPAGAIAKSTPAGKYLLENGVPVEEFNTYGSRRGNHEVMMRVHLPIYVLEIKLLQELKVDLQNICQRAKLCQSMMHV